MLSGRQKALLKYIVEEYIKNAKPVGSKNINDLFHCSSATIRSEMATLESNGLLEKTHTSSGRIPSEAGYRYYVDNLMEAKKLNGEDMLKLQLLVTNKSLELSDYINESLQIISEMTNYTSIVLGKASHDNNLKEIEIIPISNTTIVVIVVTDKGFVSNKTIDISGISMDDIKKTVSLINELISGTPIDEVSSKLEFEIKPIIGRYVKEHEIIYNTFYKVFSDFSKKNINVVGKDKMLNQPEFRDIDKVKEVFHNIDSNASFIDSNSGNDIQIVIGSENDLSDDMAVIKTNYRTSKDEGTIAIVGPKRMDYERVVSILEYLKDTLE